MPRYIDADEALRQLENNRKDNPCQAPYRGIWDRASKNAIDTIEAIPTADVIEIVRCKNCKYFSPNQEALGVIGTCYNSEMKVYDNSYCGRGVPKSEEDNLYL